MALSENWMEKLKVFHPMRAVKCFMERRMTNNGIKMAIKIMLIAMLVFIRFMVFCNYVGWSKLVSINTTLRKPTLNNDYMI